MFIGKPTKQDEKKSSEKTPDDYYFLMMIIDTFFRACNSYRESMKL